MISDDPSYETVKDQAMMAFFWYTCVIQYFGFGNRLKKYQLPFTPQ